MMSFRRKLRVRVKQKDGFIAEYAAWNPPELVGNSTVLQVRDVEANSYCFPLHAVLWWETTDAGYKKEE